MSTAKKTQHTIPQYHNMSQSSNKKVEEQTVSNPKSSVEDDAIADLRDALNRLRIPEQQQASILEQLFAPSLSSSAANAPATATGAVVVASLTLVAAPDPSVVTAAANKKAGTDNDNDDIDATVDDDAYDDDDDNDDDSGYDGNVQYPYHPPQSKIQYNSDEDSFEDYEFSQQVNYN